jgi:hypothetical protein
MSLEILDDEVKRKHISASGSGSGKTVHEHASQQLLYTKVQHDTGEKDDNGEPIFEEQIDVDARTELPSPANTAVLEWYANFLDNTFGVGKGLGMRTINERYKINMISKNRKGRNEFTMISTASGLNPQNTENQDILKKVQES